MMCFTRLGHIFLSAVTSSSLFMMFAAVSVLRCRFRIGVRSFSTTLSHVSAGLPRFLCAGLRASSSSYFILIRYLHHMAKPIQFSGKIASSSSSYHFPLYLYNLMFLIKFLQPFLSAHIFSWSLIIVSS